MGFSKLEVVPKIEGPPSSGFWVEGFVEVKDGDVDLRGIFGFSVVEVLCRIEGPPSRSPGVSLRNSDCNK